MGAFNCVVNSLILFCAISTADVSHFLSSDYPTSIVQPIPQQIQFFQTYSHPGSHSLYAPPANPTPSPVAPTTSTTTTEFSFPEVVDNRQAKEVTNFIPLRNLYQPPLQANHKPPQPSYLPPTREEIPPVIGQYYYKKPVDIITRKPIVVVEPTNQLVGYNYQVPQLPIPGPTYLPPSQTNILDTQSTGDFSPDFRVNVIEMRCLHQGGGYFHSILKVENILSGSALIDNDIYNKRCHIKQDHDSVSVDIAESDFLECGVKVCGSDLCLRLRFPIVQGLRTAKDGIVTLHCKAQERIAEKRHAVKFGVANLVQARTIGTFAHGGAQNEFRTHVELLRRSFNGFNRNLELNEVVQLGEELLLRTHVLAGDGWKYAKLTDVVLQRLNTTGEILNNVQLIDSMGCVNPALLSICPQGPRPDPPLGYKLMFKAVMFHGMQSGDEIMLSMRISGCLEAQDCQLQSQDCKIEGSSLGRRKRNIISSKEAVNYTRIEDASEISSISFRVAFENNNTDFSQGIINRKDIESIAESGKSFALGGVILFVILLTCLGSFLAFKLKH